MSNDTGTPIDGDQTRDTRSRSPGRSSGSRKQTKTGHRIELPDGDCLRPVLDLATEHRVSERTIKRKMHTVRHGGVSYGRDGLLREILAAESMPKRRRRRAQICGWSGRRPDLTGETIGT
jgi:hypothetical protein